jgi:hypothetical protein
MCAAVRGVRPSWEKRCFDHLVPQPLWLRFSPHALGRSDRAAALKRGRVAFRRVLDEAKQPTYKDAATIAVLSARGSEQAVLLAMLGDRHSAATMVEDLRLLDIRITRWLPRSKNGFTKDKHGRIDRGGALAVRGQLRRYFSSSGLRGASAARSGAGSAVRNYVGQETGRNGEQKSPKSRAVAPGQAVGTRRQCRDHAAAGDVVRIEFCSRLARV